MDNEQYIWSHKSEYIDEENDMYPPIDSTINKNSIKVFGVHRLYYAIYYYRIARVRELVCNEKNIFEQTYQGVDLITAICTSNPNVIYRDYYFSNNVTHFDQIFFVVLENLKEESLCVLFDNIRKNKVCSGEIQLKYIIHEINMYPHMLLALWNYGLKCSESDLEYCFNDILKTKMIRYMNDKYEHKKRYRLLMDVCPITLEPINKIAFFPDGTAYEYTAIKNHLQTSNKNPLTNEPLYAYKPRMFHKGQRDRCQKFPCKTLYIPENNAFEHIPIV